MQKRVYETADENFNLSGAGVSQEDYMEIWDSLPDEEEDRIFYASYYIEMVLAYEYKAKSGELKSENKLTVSEIIDRMQKSKDFKSALQSVGLTVSDIKETRTRLYD